ncbi:hypothetical protein [Ornithinibacillus xuwenensis]|uniref:Uncharacterized protein n=1 Tax=Ornithinibacillus xuwenensis TaxID=3144668 RepID=A0ABU9XET6_9BACI
MEQFSGAIFNGEIEPGSFYLTQVKNIPTASSLSIDHINKLTEYLNAQKESCTITVNDQIPMLLNEQDMNHLLQDLKAIVSILS